MGWSQGWKIIQICILYDNEPGETGMKDKLRELADEMEACWICASNGDGEITLETINNWSGRLSSILDAEGDGGAENKDMELFCCQCFASEASGSWDHVVVGSFCTNCCGNGTTFPLPKAAIESIRQQASWVGKRYYPHAEDLAKAPRPARSGVVSDEDVSDACNSFLAVTGLTMVSWDGMRAALEHFAKGERHER